MTDVGPTGFRPTAHPLYSGEVDVPPAPISDGAVLAGLLDRSLRMADSASVPQAVVDLAVHAWMEGHIDGEECAIRPTLMPPMIDWTMRTAGMDGPATA